MSTIFTSFGTYPPEFNEIFINYYKSFINKLPRLDLSEMEGQSSDYIEFITPELMSKVSSSVQWFIDGWERPGIAFRIRGREDAPEHVQKIQYGHTVFQLSQSPLVVTVFQRYARSDNALNSDSEWVFRSNRNELLSKAYKQWHQKDCKSCTMVYSCENAPPLISSPTGGIKPWIEGILSGKDSVFQLDGPIQDGTGKTLVQQIQATRYPSPTANSGQPTSILSSVPTSSSLPNRHWFISWLCGIYEAIKNCFCRR